MPIRRTYRYRADPAAKPNLQAITCAGNRIDSRTNRKNHRMGCVVQSRMTVSTKDAFKVVPQRNQEANPKNGISAIPQVNRIRIQAALISGESSFLLGFDGSRGKELSGGNGGKGVDGACAIGRR